MIEQSFAEGPAEQKRKSSFWIWLLVGGAVAAVFLVAIVALAWYAVGDSGGDGISMIGGGRIAVIDVDGVILSSDTIDDQLKKFSDDDSVKAIILHIDSPGGGAAASQEIYHAVRRVRDEKKKRIVASIQSTGASGAYYIASATNKIYANQASVVGSIGVIAEWINYGDLLKWAKLKQEVLKAGELKDAGSPARDLTPAERVYMQSLIDNMHGQFIADVASGRNLKVDDVKAIASGRVWTGEQAVPLHLVDQTGDFRDALMDTAKSVGISGEPTIVRPAKPRTGLLDVLTGDNAGSLIPNPAKMLEKNAGFYFLWR